MRVKLNKKPDPLCHVCGSATKVHTFKIHSYSDFGNIPLPDKNLDAQLCAGCEQAGWRANSARANSINYVLNKIKTVQVS